MAFGFIHVHAVGAAIRAFDRSCEPTRHGLIAQATDGPAEVNARQSAQDLGGGKGTEAHQKSVGTSRNSTAHRRASRGPWSIAAQLPRGLAERRKMRGRGQARFVGLFPHHKAAFTGDFFRQRVGCQAESEGARCGDGIAAL
jgi:hypothetical protein